MKFPRLLAAIVLISLGFVAAPLAQTTSYSGSYSGSNGNGGTYGGAYAGSSSIYQFGGYPGRSGSGYGGSTNVFNVNASAGNSMNFLGCGGIGIFNFTKLTFNMNNVVEQLKTSMQTMLAKTLLTTAMSIPQVAAIFDTLNAFGNARFDLFNQSCNLSQIKKDARQAVIDKCVKDGGDAVTCQNNWDSQANAGKWIGDALKNICGYENFNQSVRPAACDSGACSLMAFIPQYRLNLSGGVGGNGGGAYCSGGSSNYGTKPPVFVLQAVVDSVRTGSSIFTHKSQELVASARAAGVTQAQMDLALDAADAACDEDPDGCGGDGNSSVAAISKPGFVQLAGIDYKQLGFADDSTATDDTTIAEFKKYIGCSDKADPLRKTREFYKQLQKINPNASISSIDLSGKDALDVTKSLSTASLSGDNAAVQQLGVDVKAAAQLIQVATACIMAGQMPVVDNHMMVDLVYNQDSSCADAYRSGASVRVAHLASVAVFRFYKMKAKDLETAILSGKSKAVEKSQDGSIVDQPDSDAVPEDVTNKQLETVRAVQAKFEDDIQKENASYAMIKDTADWNKNSGACRSSRPIEVVPASDGGDE